MIFWTRFPPCEIRRLWQSSSRWSCPLSMSQSHILHVDDDVNDLLLFEHACRKVGVSCQLHAVNDGEEAIAYLQGANRFADRQQFPLPDLVLLDLKMPRLSGF